MIYPQENAISACMIVRDEEELLGECLESISDFADEIIILDTGSVDKTIEIAKSFQKVRLFEAEWKNDFSKARNYSMKKAQGDWIFIIDADERLNKSDAGPLKQLLGVTKADLVSVGIWNDFAISPSTFLTSVRLFRRTLNLKYNGAIHNQLVIETKVTQENTKYRIHHLGYDLSEEKMLKKHDRTRDLLEKQIEEDPENAYAIMNLAQLYRVKDSKFNIGCADALEETCKAAIALTEPRQQPRFHVYLQMMDLLGWTYLNTGKVDKALSCALETLKHKEDYLDSIFLAGFCFYEKKMYDKSMFWLNRYLTVHDKYDPAKQYDNVIFMYLGRHPECWTWIGKSAFHLKEYDKAINCLFAALKIKPTITEAYKTLEMMHSRNLITDAEMGRANDAYVSKETPITKGEKDGVHSRAV